MRTIRGKRVLITGVSGFIGGALRDKLNKKGALVYGISRKIQNDKNVKNIDILNFSLLEEFIIKNKIRVIIHLAGESLVESGQKDPFTTFKVNTEGTLNILELVRKHNLEKVIIASTSHVYGKNKLPYYEGYMPRPTRPYETSKACTDLIAQSYAESFNLPVVIPRFVNVYGPGDLNFTRLIPKTIKAIVDGKNPEMWGGQAVREYLYIDDAVDAYLKLITLDIEKVGKNRVFNIGSGELISVKDLISKIILLTDMNRNIKKIEDKREMEISAQYVSTKKAKKLLGWDANINLDKGLKKTIIWYKEILDHPVSKTP